MTEQNGIKPTIARANGNGLGPVAREKYESILQTRVRRCIAAQESKIQAHREEALQLFLERNGFADKIASYRALLEELLDSFGYPDWQHPVWLRDNAVLRGNAKVTKEVNGILRALPELKAAFAELERLRQFEDQVTEKVWLAGAPGEIAELLKEIGEPPVEHGVKE